MLLYMRIQQCKPRSDYRQVVLDILEDPVIDAGPVWVPACQGADPHMIEGQPKMLLREFRLALAQNHRLLAAKLRYEAYYKR
jgi:hypothetical protein